QAEVSIARPSDAGVSFGPTFRPYVRPNGHLMEACFLGEHRISPSLHRPVRSSPKPPSRLAVSTHKPAFACPRSVHFEHQGIRIVPGPIARLPHCLHALRLSI